MVSCCEIFIVVVLFNPTEKDLRAVDRLSLIYKGAIVDNSENCNFKENNVGLMTYVPLLKNFGIAKAQNIGLQLSFERDTQFVVLLDQDTRIETDYPKQIVNEFIEQQKKYINLALLAPTAINSENEKVYYSVVHKEHLIGESLIKKREIIASGSCILTEAIKKIGFFDESLFIDYVDFDFCWRANRLGMLCAQTKNISIRHKVGDRDIYIGKYIITLSKPFRYFYQYRNWIWLLRKNYVPLNWKINSSIKNILRLVYFPLLIKGGCSRAKYMLKGIYAGIKTKMQ